MGAAGSTGRGEANLYGLCSFLIVESMRRGMHPKDAGMEALKRIRANTIEKRLCRADGNPNFNISFYVLNANGEYAGVAMYREDEDERKAVGQTEGRLVRYCICTENGPQMLVCEPLLPGTLARLSRFRARRCSPGVIASRHFDAARDPRGDYTEGLPPPKPFSDPASG